MKRINKLKFSDQPATPATSQCQNFQVYTVFFDWIVRFSIISHFDREKEKTDPNFSKRSYQPKSFWAFSYLDTLYQAACEWRESALGTSGGSLVRKKWWNTSFRPTERPFAVSDSWVVREELKEFRLAWQVDHGDVLPLGVPQLMMAFVEDEQLREDLRRQRDEYYQISSKEKREQRADLVVSKLNLGADAWTKSGKAVQLTTSESKMKLTKWISFFSRWYLHKQYSVF